MARQPRRNRPRQPVVESLERLELLSASLVKGVWTLGGTAAADKLIVTRDTKNPQILDAFLNGRKISAVPAASVSQIRILGLGGNDTLKVDESHGAIGVKAVLNGGVGKNQLTGGSGPTTLDGGPSKTSILQPGVGPTTLLRGVAADSVQRLGSGNAFRQFLNRSSASHTGAGGGARYKTPSAGLAAGAGTADNSHSTTNVQVAGVGEADLVETDGKDLYLISRSDLVIVDATDPSKLAIDSRTPLNGSPVGEYLDGNRLTVISSVWSDLPMPIEGGAGGAKLPSLWARGDSRVQVTTFDVTDPAHPVIVALSSYDGFYDDSRMVDGRLELILQSDLFAGLWGGGVGIGGGGIAVKGGATTRSSAAANGFKNLANAPLDQILPGYTATVFGANGAKTTKSGLITQPADILVPAVGDDANLLSVVVVDTRGTSPGPVGTASLLGSYASTIHVTQNQIDIFSPHWDDQGNTTTSIHQFNLTNGGTTPVLTATGSAPGGLFDPYSADVSDGYLRVATSSWTGNSTNNGVYVLKQQGDRLNVVGMVDHLAPGESITGARFEGDRAFVVTFEYTDPLWAIDLSNPTKPTVAGELKLPGYSRFLQPLDGNTLLGVGRDADPKTGMTTDLKLSLFDVHNLANPTLIATQKIDPGTAEWTWSAAEWDPHALGWFPELGVVAVPVSGSLSTTSSTDPGLVDWKTVSNLNVFHIDATAGANAFQTLGQVTHDSAVSRSVRIGDVVFSIADLDVQAVQVVAGALKPLGKLTIQTDTSGGGVPILF
ncbi:MAG: beta-propeller domain-containing protein [Isosphaeraceae bacterium]